MPNQNDSVRAQRRATLGAQLEAIKAKIQADPNNQALAAQRARIEQQIKNLNDPRRRQPRPAGKGKENP